MSLSVAQNNNPHRRTWLPTNNPGSRAGAWIVLLVSLLATLAAWKFLEHKAAEAQVRRFDIRVEVIRHWFEDRAKGYNLALHAGAGLLVSSDEVTPLEWEKFVRFLEVRVTHPGLTQLAFVAHPGVSRNRGVILPGAMTAPSQQELLIRLIAPGQPPALGPDLGKVAVYRQAAEASRDSGLTQLSAFPQPAAGGPHLPALFLPFYENLEDPSTPQERRRLLAGWVVAWFEPHVLLESMPWALARHLDLEVFAAEDPDISRRIFDTNANDQAWIPGSVSALEAMVPLEIAGNVWTLAVKARPDFAGSEQGGAKLVFVVGLITSLILFFVTDTLASSRMRALAAANLMTDRLHKSEAYSRAVVANAPVGFLTFTPGGTLETVNAAAEQIFGYRAHELVGGTFDELLQEPSELKAAGYDDFTEFRGEVGRRSDGTSFPLELSICSTTAGDRRGYIAIVVDVTEREQAAEALRSERDFSAAVLNLAPALVVVTDLKGRIVAFNRACEQTTGYSYDEMKGKPMLDLVAPEGQDAARNVLEQLCSGVYPIHYEGYWIAKGGERRLISWANTASRDAEGAPKHVIACGEDVTEQRKAQRASERYVVELELAQQITKKQAEMLAKQAAELATARDVALESAQMKTQFLTNMSHEIRTPMSGVLGMTHLILGTDLNEEQHDYAATIRSSAEALLVIINDILDFSKIEAGKLHFETIDFNLADTVHGAAQLLAQQVANKGIELKVSVAPDVPAWVRGDPGRLRQVLLNLIGNAVKFTSKGSVTVTATLQHLSSRHVALAFSVRDSGIGISQEAQSRLFQPFVQADGSTSRRHGGTGLGLAISKQLVERMGGDIECLSNPGEGSEFRFTITLKKGNPVDRAQLERELFQGDQAKRLAEAVRSGGAPANHNAPDAEQTASLRVLVAEDNLVNQKVVLRMLRKFGCSAEVAENGRQALAALERAPYDLILMDCQMPEMDGYQTTAEIRRIENGKNHVPIIALTAHAVEGARDQCLAAGMDDFLTKPIDPQALSAALQRWGAPNEPVEAPAVEAHDAAL